MEKTSSVHSHSAENATLSPPLAAHSIFFADLKKPKHQRQFHYPQFKKKGEHAGFRADNGTDKNHPNAVVVNGKRVKPPVIGWVKMREALCFEGNIKSAVVSRTADRWFVSLSVEIDHVAPMRENQAVVGVDLGIKALATLSDNPVESPKALRRNLKKLKRLSRSLGCKVKG
jgi:putative transposase